MGAVIGHAFACSMRGLLRPWTMCVSAASGQFGPKGTVCRYGMLHAQKAKSVLVDVFQYLIVVCSMSKKSLFSWQISRTEFRALFQDPTRAGRLQGLHLGSGALRWLGPARGPWCLYWGHKPVVIRRPPLQMVCAGRGRPNAACCALRCLGVCGRRGAQINPASSRLCSSLLSRLGRA